MYNLVCCNNDSKLLSIRKGKEMISKTVRNVCETGKIHLIENYDLAQNDIYNMWECHHRLEI